MAKAAGVSRSTVQRVWDANGLQRHRVTTIKLSKDPESTGPTKPSADSVGCRPENARRGQCRHRQGGITTDGPDLVAALHVVQWGNSPQLLVDVVSRTQDGHAAADRLAQ